MCGHLAFSDDDIVEADGHLQIEAPGDETSHLCRLAEPGVVDGHIWLQGEGLQSIIVDDQGGTWDVIRAGGRGRTGVGEGGPVQASGFFFSGGPPVPVEVAVKGRDVTVTSTMTITLAIDGCSQERVNGQWLSSA